MLDLFRSSLSLVFFVFEKLYICFVSGDETTAVIDRIIIWHRRQDNTYPDLPTPRCFQICLRCSSSVTDSVALSISGWLRFASPSASNVSTDLSGESFLPDTACVGFLFWSGIAKIAKSYQWIKLVFKHLPTVKHNPPTQIIKARNGMLSMTIGAAILCFATDTNRALYKIVCVYVCLRAGTRAW